MHPSQPRYLRFLRVKVCTSDPRFSAASQRRLAIAALFPLGLGIPSRHTIFTLPYKTEYGWKFSFVRMKHSQKSKDGKGKLVIREGIQVNPSVEEAFARIGPGKGKINYDKCEKVFRHGVAVPGTAARTGFSWTQKCVNTL